MTLDLTRRVVGLMHTMLDMMLDLIHTDLGWIRMDFGSKHKMNGCRCLHNDLSCLRLILGSTHKMNYD